MTTVAPDSSRPPEAGSPASGNRLVSDAAWSGAEFGLEGELAQRFLTDAQGGLVGHPIVATITLILFGSMVDLPPGMPKHTHDLQQWANTLGNPRFPKDPKNEHHALADARWNVQVWQKLKQIEQGRTR